MTTLFLTNSAGRNHVPCCQRAGVPDVCQDMCVGSYTVQTDDARSHVSCAAYTAATLVCIAEGVGKKIYLYEVGVIT